MSRMVHTYSVFPPEEVLSEQSQLYPRNSQLQDTDQPVFSDLSTCTITTPAGRQVGSICGLGIRGAYRCMRPFWNSYYPSCTVGQEVVRENVYINQIQSSQASIVVVGDNFCRCCWKTTASRDWKKENYVILHAPSTSIAMTMTKPSAHVPMPMSVVCCPCSCPFF